MGQILLSYTTMDDLYKASHNWINKAMDIKKPESEAMTAGKLAHQRLQAHISGGEQVTGLELPMNFPKIEYHARRPWDDQFTFHGYVDAANFASKSFLEIKTSGGALWSQGKFNASIQPAYYSWVTGLRKAYFITCHFDLSDLKIYTREFTDEDLKKAEDWAMGAIDIIKKGDFTGGLVDGKCDGSCGYPNCYFL